MVSVPEVFLQGVLVCFGHLTLSCRRAVLGGKRALSKPKMDNKENVENDPGKSDLVVFLDMDETLIYNCENSENQPMGKADSKECEVILEYECSSRGWCTVFKRPHVDYFLQQLSQRYSRIYIFTAATKLCADPILDHLDPQGTIITKRFYRDSCVKKSHPSKYVQSEYRKDVTALNIQPAIDPKRYVFLDDQWVYTLENPYNTIPISGFNNPCNQTDPGLLRALDLIRLLDGFEDVRPALDKLFDCTGRKNFQSFNVWLDPIPVEYLF
jgi:TFIIF-interacting CTD phosphatase-like protein